MPDIIPPAGNDSSHFFPWANAITAVAREWNAFKAKYILDQRNASMATKSAIDASIRNFTAQIESVTEITTLLAEVANVKEAEFADGVAGVSGPTGFTGYFGATMASVTLTSITGVIEIGFGGSLNGGDGYFVYSITDTTTGLPVVDRATVLANPAQRVAVSGGASFTPSGWKTVFVTVPAGDTLVVNLELNTASTGTFFYGGSIMAHTALTTH